MRPNLLTIVLLGLTAVVFSSATAAAQLACTDDLIGWWTGDGVATDAWGGNHGTLGGAAGYEPGVVNEAFSFAGGRWVGPNAASQWPTGSFTVDAWVKTSASGASQVVFSMYECGSHCPSNSAASLVQLSIGSTGQPVGSLRTSNNVALSITGPSAINDGAFHHIAFVRDLIADEARLYVDGVEAISAPLAGAHGPMGNDDLQVDSIFIGSKQAPGSSAIEAPFFGAIDEVALYHRPLSDLEVQGIFGNEADGRCPAGTTDPITPVPELGAVALFVAGAAVLAGVFAVRRRR